MSKAGRGDFMDLRVGVIFPQSSCDKESHMGSGGGVWMVISREASVRHVSGADNTPSIPTLGRQRQLDPLNLRPAWSKY